ncbi:MAG: MmoB/DmpM family protein [Actinobacteria bacterium]|nr:MmoB/DmpM family protein [Actinomycetota bacterium]
MSQAMTSDFDENRTSSNMTGVTLMNNQNGYVIGKVMEGREGIEVTEYPSMVRIDAQDRMEFDFEEISEAIGEEFRQPDFEEVMSTHYGRMVIDDETENVLFFANPEDAAEYIGFDLEPVE